MNQLNFTAKSDAAPAKGQPSDPSIGSTDSGGEVLIDYTNWRGERGVRRIRPLSIWFGATEFHPHPQHLLRAIDVAKDAERDFAMASIHSWEEVRSLAS